MSERIPDFQTLMHPLLASLADGHPHELREILDRLTTQFALTEEDLKVKVPSGQMSLFRNRVGWARSYLKYAGLITYPKRGVYQITDAGKKTLGEKIDYINIAYLRKFDEFQKWQSSFAQSEVAETDPIASQPAGNKTPEEILGNTFRELNSNLSYDLLELLKNRSFKFFEVFVLQFLSGMGYGGAEEKNFEVVGQSGDNGIDGIIYQDKLGIERIYVQAKRWKDNKVQSKDIRDFIGSLSLKGTNKGVFITTSDFTDDARNTVLMNPQNRIILIDGKRLAELAIEHNIGVQIKETYYEKRIDYDFFEEE